MASKARRRRILGATLAAVAGATALAGPARADAGAACEATYQVVGVWANVHRGDIVVTNTGDAPTSGWQVSWTFGNGQTLWAIWFAQAATGGTDVTATNTVSTRIIAPGASKVFSFIAVGGPDPAPDSITCVAF